MGPATPPQLLTGVQDEHVAGGQHHVVQAPVLTAVTALDGHGDETEAALPRYLAHSAANQVRRRGNGCLDQFLVGGAASGSEDGLLAGGKGALGRRLRVSVNKP